MRDEMCFLTLEREESQSVSLNISSFLFFFFNFNFYFFSATPATYGGSQARGLIGAIAADLCQSHSNTRSKLRL